MIDSKTPHVLSFTEVSKNYGKTTALKSVTFNVMENEMVGLLGPNGAGKSTLFQIATGLVAQDSGTVEMFERDYRASYSEILSKLGVVFQARSLDMDISGKANLKFHGNLFGLFGPKLRRRIEEVSEMMEIQDMLKQPVKKLSGGNQRRIEIARALLNKPKLLLLDEASVGLDAAARQRLVKHMRLIGASQGTAILWATHIVNEVEDADRIIILNNGTIVCSDTPAALIDLAKKSSLSDAYISLVSEDQS